jgi:hypothetical protein
MVLSIDGTFDSMPTPCGALSTCAHGIAARPRTKSALCSMEQCRRRLPRYRDDIASLRRRSAVRTSSVHSRRLLVIPVPTTLTHPVIRDSPVTPIVLRSDPPAIASGDVLVSRPTARADVYDISVIAGGARISCARYEDGMETGRELARELLVDGWFTCDHTHFVRIARHRPATVPLGSSFLLRRRSG